MTSRSKPYRVLREYDAGLYRQVIELSHFIELAKGLDVKTAAIVERAAVAGAVAALKHVGSVP